MAIGFRRVSFALAKSVVAKRTTFHEQRCKINAIRLARYSRGWKMGSTHRNLKINSHSYSKTSVGRAPRNTLLFDKIQSWVSLARDPTRPFH
jgi:hypothetical protein